MSRKFQHATAFAVAATLLFTIAGAASSGAFAQDPAIAAITGEGLGEFPAAGSGAGQSAQPGEDEAAPAVRFVAQEVVQAIPGQPSSTAAVPADTGSLSDLVASIETGEEMSKDLRCLAGAIYFEARGEPLAGQLAVGQVIVNRAESGKFPSSYCGVVYQRSQFSFVHGGRMPAINTSSTAWHNAAAIARIAHEGLAESPVKDALYFHASYVRPGWHRTRVAQVNSHVFYR